MKTFVIHTPAIPKTKLLAAECAASFRKYKGWGDVSLFAGCDPHTLPKFEEKYGLENDRARFPPDHKKFKSKKSCFYSHYDLWNKCVELDEPIAIIEYDTYCVGDYPEYQFDGVLHLAVLSILKLGVYSKMWPKDYKRVSKLPAGVHSIDGSQKYRGHSCIPGNIAYSITPHAARNLIEDCKLNGWQQNDIIMTDEFFPVECILPPVVIYDTERELHTSSRNDQ